MSVGVALRSLTRESSVRVRNYDESDWAESVELFTKLRRHWHRGVEDELSGTESENCHANWDRDEPALPAKLILGAPEIRIVLN